MWKWSKKGAEYCECCGLRLINNEPIKIKFNYLIVFIICIVLFVGIIVIINNKKVISIKFSTSGYLSQEQITSIAKNIMTNMVIWIVYVKNEDDAKEGENLLTELLDKTSYDKGLTTVNSFSK